MLLTSKQMALNKAAGLSPYGFESVAYEPGMSINTAVGTVNPQDMGFKYVRYTTDVIRGEVIEQQFYEIKPSDFMPIEVGVGAYMEGIKTNKTFMSAGSFESGLTRIAAGKTNISKVDVGMTPVTQAVYTFTDGYEYNILELNAALKANQWDVVRSKHNAAVKLWQLGLQKVAFLGLLSDNTNCPGLLTQSDVTTDTTNMPKAIKDMSSTEIQAFVAMILELFQENCGYTRYPDVFVMPTSDWNGCGQFISSDFPIGMSRIEFLKKVFVEITGNAGFKILPLAYANKAKNTGYINSSTGKNRYALYCNDTETVKMDIPLDFTFLPPGTGNNFSFEGVGFGQFTGPKFFRPELCYYLDPVSQS